MSEFSGVIANGLDRGWTREEIRVSLLNAGYPQQEIDSEINSTGRNLSQTQSPTFSEIKPLDKYQTPIVRQKSKANLLIWIFLLASILVVGVFLGIYFLI